MPTPSLPRRFALPVLVLLASACSLPDARVTAVQLQGKWLQANAHPIRSLDVADRDFSDLEPLKAAIGSSRVVLLGEQSHGDGTTFLAKARLIAFLHREMGFDVLAWESGIWDVHRVWEHVQAGEAVIPASRRGVFTIWTRSEQVLPTLDYVQETLGTAHPLELAGFDNQLTGTLARDSLHLLVEAFARKIGSSAADDPEWPAAMATLHHLAQTGDLTTEPSAADEARLLRLLGVLKADAAAKGAGDRDALFWAQALESLTSFAQMQWGAPGRVGFQESNARDAQMGKNLLWLANVWYPGKKIIVWAASAHIGREMAQLRSADGFALYQDGWTVHMGGEAYAVLGTQMYALGFTAAQGTMGFWFSAPMSVAPPRRGSLERGFLEAGMENAFVDFRSLPAGGEWLRDVYTRPFGYADLYGDWTRILDGMVYTRDMVPSTPATR